MRQLAPLMLILSSALVAVTAYLQALETPFVSDDVIQIKNNTKLADLHWSELWRLFIEPYNAVSEFQPLRDFSYWFDMTMFGLNPPAFHVHNIVLYLLCLPLVYSTTLWLWRYFRPADAASAPWAAAAVTALFALHPTLVEPVVWITGRKYVLPNLFSMLALWFAMKVKYERGFSTPHAAAALLAFVAVMLSKASYVAVAPVIAMLWVIFWRDIPKPDRHRSLLLWPLAILFLAGLLVLVFISRSFVTTPAYFGVETFPRVLAVLGWLARLAVSPESRHLFYPVGDPYLPVMIAIGVAVLAFAAVGATMLLRKRSLESFALVVFLLLCIPHLQIIPYGAPSLVQDRFLALAAWPAVLLIVALAWRLKPVPRTALLFAIAISWGFQTMERPRDWRSFETLLDVDLRANPGYYMPAVYKIFAYQLHQGLYQEASETADSITIPEYRDIMVKLVKANHAVNVDAVLTGKPYEAMALLQNLGPILNQLPVEAKWNSPVQVTWDKCQSNLLRQWLSLAKQFPDDVQVRYNAGLWMSDAGYYNNAIVHFRAAIESQRLPESLRSSAFKNIGLALVGLGRVAEAEAPLHAALAQPQPDMQAECLLSVVYKLTNRFGEAARAEASCPKQNPNGVTLPFQPVKN
jgi:tetratricopeptide (TPR) repeat protein